LDPITDIMQTMHLRAVVHSRLEATAPWGLAHSPTEADNRAAQTSVPRIFPSQLAHFGMVSRGNCWLSANGIPDPIPPTGGDCFLLAPGSGYTLRDSLRTRPRSYCEAARPGSSNVIQYGGGGAPTTIISGFFSFDEPSVKPMSQLLPALNLIKSEQARSLALHTTIQLLASKMTEQAPRFGSGRQPPGRSPVHSDIARSHCIRQGKLQTRMAPRNLRLTNRGCPQCRARQCGPSVDCRVARRSRRHVTLGLRSSLQRASRTKHPGIREYVTDWRMQKAIQLLPQRDKKLIDTAQRVGYESDAAFSKAFKRIVGLTPGEYRRSVAHAEQVASA